MDKIIKIKPRDVQYTNLVIIVAGLIWSIGLKSKELGVGCVLSLFVLNFFLYIFGTNEEVPPRKKLGICRSLNASGYNLTYGKTYEILETLKGEILLYYKIVDNSGCEQFVHEGILEILK